MHRASVSGGAPTSDIADISEVLIDVAYTQIAVIPVTKSNSMMIRLLNGNQPLDRLKVESSENGVDYSIVAETFSDFISLAGILTYTNGEMVTLGASILGIMKLDISGSETHIRLSGSVTDTK